MAAGLVPLALGTDTAGSGRVPARLNNIVGLKPSLGLISTTGVVPACRTLDCVSVFALDRRRRLDGAGGDGRPRRAPIPIRATGRSAPIGALPPTLRLGVPRNGQLIFFGDKRFASKPTTTR